LQCKGASFGGGLHDLALETSISSGFAPLKIGSGISFAIRVVFFFLITIAATVPRTLLVKENICPP
jgi:tagatose-1,6-bisphosphate aldolase non-catalytic subunit AgaZ/GatZ